MVDKNQIRIAYILSMKSGLRGWLYREIEELAKSGAAVTLFPTKYTLGAYAPKPEWALYVYNPINVLLRQAYYLWHSPRLYLRLLKVAFRTKSLVDFVLGFDFAHQMRKRHVERVHCVPGGHQLFIGYYVKSILKIPLSVAIYGYELDANPNWGMAREALEVCDVIVTNCEHKKRQLIELFGNDKIRAEVIRHWHEPVKTGDGKVRGLVVAGFLERKGHRVLFEAMKGLDDLNLWVAGYPGPVDVAQLARDAGVADRVAILGEVTDEVLQFLYQSCDLFVLPSKAGSDSGVEEGVPVALIEAMSYGKPVVSTRLGGIPELVEEILVEPDDVDQLRAALHQLIVSPQLRRDLGCRNRKIVAEKYGKANMIRMRQVLLGENG
ncbi:MAG: glycosyltransferase family 4 protein [Chloroflexi bacterium]|nr:glycosyltransferase family 4 protein [Chloroflexota bacterium]